MPAASGMCLAIVRPVEVLRLSIMSSYIKYVTVESMETVNKVTS